ncbi:MAG: 50S ribosomal protein L23 [Deltaproteobacteria bacterium]|nr:50S ribosomal protein L23 [Deltaproteobacteria bacterium]MBI3079451.1 50S ribosomal protein L23 [Deltaproteobacteria bacterium]
MRDIHQVLMRPLITEKSTALREAANQYVFQVAPDANKIEIKQAVEQLFRVKVAKVRTLNIEGKRKRLGRFAGRRPDWKKAVVTLRQGQKIEFFEGA